jgi:membrane fusion protein (multidrug efflux system)
VTELQGTYQVAGLDENNIVHIETVQVGDRIGSQWIVKEGLKPGERVVADGVMKIRPGLQVNPTPYVALAGNGGAN